MFWASYQQPPLWTVTVEGDTYSLHRTEIRTERSTRPALGYLMMKTEDGQQFHPFLLFWEGAASMPQSILGRDVVAARLEWEDGQSSLPPGRWREILNLLMETVESFADPGVALTVSIPSTNTTPHHTMMKTLEG